VLSAHVDLATNTAEVEIKNGAVEPDNIAKEVTDMGFDSMVITSAEAKKRFAEATSNPKQKTNKKKKSKKLNDNKQDPEEKQKLIISNNQGPAKKKEANQVPSDRRLTIHFTNLPRLDSDSNSVQLDEVLIHNDQDSNNVDGGDGKRVDLRVEGMTCASCVGSIESYMKSVDGVKRHVPIL